MKVSSPEKQEFSPDTNASTQRMEKKRRFCFDPSAGSIHHLNIPSTSKYAFSYWRKSTYNFPFTPTFSIQKECVQIPHLPYFRSRRHTQHKVLRRKGRRRNRKLMLKKSRWASHQTLLQHHEFGVPHPMRMLIKKAPYSPESMRHCVQN